MRRPLMRTSPSPPAPPPARPGAGNFVRSAMTLSTIGRGERLSIRMSCPRPPRKRPAPPEPGRRRLWWKNSGLCRSATSTGVDEMLLGHDNTCSPSLIGVAPMPPLKKSTVVYGRPSSRVLDWLSAQSGEPTPAMTRSGITRCSAPSTSAGT